jgi:eukaryotic-like serine/threonine-protein kinase
MADSAQPPSTTVKAGSLLDEACASTTERSAGVSTTQPSPGAAPASATESPPDTIREVPTALPRVGEVIADRYRVEGFIGSGGMAHVLAARHLELGHLVAIKVLDPGLAEDSDARQRFSREARAMAALRSKHIVRVHDVGLLDSGGPYMIMEHLEGKDLARILADSGPLPLADACLWMEQACEAVEEAHAKGIVHRDLKPHNIFLAKNDGESSVRVLDFGIARSLASGLGKLETLTKAGDIVGTLAYMAPEQIRDSKSVDPRADIWSLGACLYRLASGVRPFNGDGQIGIVESIFFDEPKPLSALREGVPTILDALIARCLAKKPEDRYPSVADLRAVLRSARASLAEPVAVRPRPITKTAPLQPFVSAAGIHRAPEPPLPSALPTPPPSAPRPAAPELPSSAPDVTGPRLDHPPSSKIQLPMSSRASPVLIAVGVAVLVVIVGFVILWVTRGH